MGRLTTSPVNMFDTDSYWLVKALALMVTMSHTEKLLNDVEGTVNCNGRVGVLVVTAIDAITSSLTTPSTNTDTITIVADVSAPVQ